MVHPGKRYLMTEDGEPFFYMGDTAWELFHRLDREEAEYYLSVRASQGINVIQAVALAEFSGLAGKNAYGRVPLKTGDIGPDPLKPDTEGEYSYWDHVDHIIKTAEQKNLYIALLPTWGDKFNKMWGEGPEIFNPENAYLYGRWIADRYKAYTNIIWMLGGDRPLTTDEHKKIIDEMARGIKEEDKEHLITFHPTGDQSSVDSVPGKEYIDFHTVQSSHGISGYTSFKLVRRTGEAENKPFMDSEPRYEDHPACFTVKTKYLWNADDIRQNTYWNMMEGVCGNTYGNHCIWSMTKEPSDYYPYTWKEVIRHPGAEQIKHSVSLRLSRPYFEFRPAPELIDDDTAVMAHQSAGRGDNYAYIYTPLGMPIRAHLGKFTDKIIRAKWFDPRTGKEETFAIVPSADTLFVPPSSGKGCDWILILESVE